MPAALGIRYVITGKFAHRDRLLSEVSWRGDERVLDVGTGGGLLAIGAARRAPRGRAIGIDIWQREDLSGNTRDRAIANARLEGVGDRVEIRDEDARTLSCADASIDVVLSMLCLHNIPEVAGREQALREIARVLKPGGTALVSDLAGTERYAQVFAELGLEVKRSGRCAGTFPWQRLVVARKR
ncbi:MAG: class I SAM-dependent methyltransferase [Deltaproteobacteria bacterium]|nr:class I SAM-dependent methyltransferase [Deltaproteobacteria bacterium]